MRPSPPPSPAASILPAILQVLVGVLLFSCSDAMSKYLRQSLSAVEIAWLRYAVFILFGLFFAGRRHIVGMRPKRPWLQVLRAVTLLGSAVFFIAGLEYLPMAEASALGFVSPAFITALSVPFLGERVGLQSWLATAIGLIGVLIVIRPGTDALQVAALWPVSSAACWAVAMIATKMIGSADRSETTLLWSSGVGLALLTLVLPLGFARPSWGEVGLGLCLGVTASTGQYLLILAYRRASASVLAPFSYIQLLFSATLGYLVFGNLPDEVAFLGAGVIIVSGLLNLRSSREVKTAEPANRAAEAPGS